MLLDHRCVAGVEPFLDSALELGDGLLGETCELVCVRMVADPFAGCMGVVTEDEGVDAAIARVSRRRGSVEGRLGSSSASSDAATEAPRWRARFAPAGDSQRWVPKCLTTTSSVSEIPRVTMMSAPNQFAVEALSDGVGLSSGRSRYAQMSLCLHHSSGRHVCGVDTYPTVEHAYQAAKTHDRTARRRIREASTAADAKTLGQDVTLRDDWDTVKLDIMRQLLRSKFTDPDLAGKLRATGRRRLVEGNTWGDAYWGVDATTGEGENWLGRLLEEG